MWQWVKNQYHLLVAFCANVYYGFPSRKLIIVGITGTSGKTTTSHMIYEVLKAGGYKVSLLSSIKAVIGDKEYDTGFHVTTPDPHNLPKYLKQAVDHGDTHFVLEVSSHGLDQNRAAFVHFRIGVLTTLAHEHLDYHKTIFKYARAKFKLLHASDIAVIPEDGITERLKSFVKYHRLKNKIVTFGLHSGSETQEKWKFHLKIPGNYNIRNALAAAGAAIRLDVSEQIIKKTLENFTAIPGRFEEIANDKGFRIIIDFAHKPDAIESVLQAAREEITDKGRIIIMYGAASQRDTLKRPMMGEISGKLAEITVLTDEDPRFEESIEIINQIAQGCRNADVLEKNKESFTKNTKLNTHIFFKIPDRQEAIEFIIQKVAKQGDIILFCGKGHEQSMNYRGIEKPWSEHKAVKKALRHE